MSSPTKYIQDTLTMPSSMPLFNYNINFQGLKHLIQQLNIQTNTNTDQIKSIKQQLIHKLHSQKLNQQEQILNNCLKLGLNTQKTIQGLQTLIQRQQKKDQLSMNNMQLYGNKMGKISKIIEYILNLVHENNQKINKDDHKHQKNIQQSYRRIDQKIQSSLQSMKKNINLYFTETNKKLASLQTQLNGHKRQTAANVENINNGLNQRITHVQLKSALSGINQQVKSSILADLNDDNMKRLATLNQYSNKLKQHIKQSQIKIKAAKTAVKQLTEKVAKTLPIQTFQVEKHKIFQRLSEYKSKIDDLNRKNLQFVDFRKSFYQSNERVKHNLLQLEDDIKKLGQKGSSFKKMQDIGSLLSSLDPHLICQIGSQVKLHEKQIGKLQKQVTYLQNELQSARNNNTKMPQINGGQNADMIMKIIKEYMTNLDFEGRVKRTQNQLYNLSKKNDGVNQLQKKIYLLSKQIDVGAIMKQIKRKSDDQTTRKDFKILDSKLQKLFQFYKQTRRQIEQLYKRSTMYTKDSSQNASLTTKKLYGANCISCTSRQKSANTSRLYSKTKLDLSIDQSYDGLKKSMYVKGGGTQ